MSDTSNINSGTLQKKFLTADGTWCHILSDRIVFGQPPVIAYYPDESDKPNAFYYYLGIAGLLILSSLFTYLLTADLMIIELWTVIVTASAFGIYHLFINRDTAGIQNLLKNKIISSKHITRKTGYNKWIVTFKSSENKKLRKVVRIYDNAKLEADALEVLTAEGYS